MSFTIAYCATVPTPTLFQKLSTAVVPPVSAGFAGAAVVGAALDVVAAVVAGAGLDAFWGHPASRRHENDRTMVFLTAISSHRHP
jgi:hypothetical protein